MRRKEAAMWVEVQRALLQCAGDADCERISTRVVQAIRPSFGQHGERTDVTVFGLCPGHAMHWRNIMRDLGWWEGMCVEWAALGELLDEMQKAGWDMRRAIA